MVSPMHHRIRRRQRKTPADRIFHTFNNTFLWFILLLVLYPLVYIVSSSFSSPKATMAGHVWLYPVDFTLLGYQRVFEQSAIARSYFNTVFYTVFGTITSLFLTVCAAYPLSRKRFRGKGLYTFIIAFTMFFGGGLIPTYILIRSLGMVNTRWVMIIPNAVFAWNIIITRTYYQTTISDEILESAKMDGCSDFRFIGSIVLPLSGAITAVNVLFYAVDRWNSFFDAFIYLNSQELFPLTILLRKILVSSQFEPKDVMGLESEAARIGLREVIKYSLIIVASFPVLCMYPFVQKYFVKGIMVGSIKG